MHRLSRGGEGGGGGGVGWGYMLCLPQFLKITICIAMQLYVTRTKWKYLKISPFSQNLTPNPHLSTPAVLHLGPQLHT